MMPRLWRRLLPGEPGFTLVELLITTLVTTLVLFAVGTMYLAATRAMDDGSTMAFVQRQGTQIQEELARHIQRATVVEVDNTQSLCHPAGGTVPAGKSIIYKRTVGSTGSPTNPATDEYWCLYEFKRTTDPSPQLWRCQLAGLTPPQTCTTTPENLLASSLRAFRGLGLGDTGAAFGAYSGPTTCPSCPTSLNMRFALDIITSGSSSLIGGPRWFGFNLTIRNQ